METELKIEARSFGATALPAEGGWSRVGFAMVFTSGDEWRYSGCVAPQALVWYYDGVHCICDNYESAIAAVRGRWALEEPSA